MSKQKDSAEKTIRDIRRATRRRYSAEDKVRVVLEGLRSDSSIAELCFGIHFSHPLQPLNFEQNVQRITD
jgi:transposase